MKVSARNVFKGTISALVEGAVNAEVVIELPGGAKVTSVVTREAVAELGLAKGVSATAVIKASHVILGVPAQLLTFPSDVLGFVGAVAFLKEFDFEVKFWRHARRLVLSALSNAVSQP
nr:TOBE domain-containing protein [Pseudomonas sp. BN102]